MTQRRSTPVPDQRRPVPYGVDYRLALLLGTAALAGTQALPPALPRALLALPLSLLLPGAALLTAVRPAWTPEPAQRAILSMVLGMAALPGVALGLCCTGHPVTSANALRGTALCMLLLCALTTVAHWCGTTDTTPCAPDYRLLRHACGLAVPLAGVAVIMAWALATLPLQHQSPFTQFWLNGAVQWPRRSVEGTGVAVRVPVRIENHTAVRHRFALQGHLAADAPWPARTVLLAPRAVWSGWVGGKCQATTHPQALHVSLTDLQSRQALTLTAWVPCQAVATNESQATAAGNTDTLPVPWPAHATKIRRP